MATSASPVCALRTAWRALLERIADDDPELLRFFAECGTTVGAELTVGEGAPYSDALTVRPAKAPEDAVAAGITTKAITKIAMGQTLWVRLGERDMGYGGSPVLRVPRSPA